MSAREEPLQTCDSRPDADEAARLWAAEIVRHGLAATHGVFIRFIRTGDRYAHWGVFVGPHTAGGA